MIQRSCNTRQLYVTTISVLMQPRSRPIRILGRRRSRSPRRSLRASRARSALRLGADPRHPSTSARRTTLGTSCAFGPAATDSRRSANSPTWPRIVAARSAPGPSVPTRGSRIPAGGYLVVAVDPVTLQILALSTRDRQGGVSTLTFSNLKENQGITDKDICVPYSARC